MTTRQDDFSPRRRHLFGVGLAACGLLALPSLHAAGSDVGPKPALVKPLAAKGLLLAIARAGQRLVAVGERGHVLLSDDEGRTWRQAAAVPTRATLAALHAVDDKRLWAAGHGGTLMRSEDAGEHWQLVPKAAQARDVLLAVRVEADGRGLAVGGFGLALVTTDGGTSWDQAELLPGEAGEKHLNQIFVSAKGSWLIAAEGGQVLRRAAGAAGDLDKGWTAQSTPYKGSYWCGTAVGERLVVGGMRGNLAQSEDDGLGWRHLAVDGAGSFSGALALSAQKFALVGVDGTLVVGAPDGQAASLKLQRQDDRLGLHAALATAKGDALVTASAAGPKVVALPA